MGSYDQLIAHQLGVPEIAAHIGADSLGFISVDRMMAAIGPREGEDPDDDHHGYCNACFTGDYPVPVQLSLASTKQRFDGVLG